MKVIMRKIINIIMLISFLSLGMILAEDVSEKDLESNVPELEEFHSIIYQIWHNAYPAKDIKALKSYVEEVNKHFAKLEKAKLPGILRDKRDAWDKGIAEFKKRVEEYNIATASNEPQNILDAAESLHAAFEHMVRIIHPVAPQIEEFHKSLYIIYHKYLPEKKYEEIKNVSDDMVKKAEEIVKVSLPVSLASKTEEFKKAAAILLQNTKKFTEACKSNSEKAIDEAINEMHTSYQKLVSIFE
jgi:valyl-tRNA synthetase